MCPYINRRSKDKSKTKKNWKKEYGFYLVSIFFSFFRYAAPRARSARDERSENKAGGIPRWGKSFDCVLNIDPCLSCSTS